MPAVQPRSSLLFQGGAQRLSPAHPMANGARYAGVAAPGGAFVDLLTGKRSTPTGGSVPSTVQANLGLAVTQNTALVYNAISNSYSDSPSSVTFAAIFDFFNAAPPDMIFTTNPAMSGNLAALYMTSSGLTVTLGATAITSPFVAPAGGTYGPVFAAVSSSSAQQNWVVVQLRTGKIWTATTTTACTPTVGSSTTWSIDCNSGTYSPSGAKIAAVAYSVNNFMNPAQLFAWAQDPWAYWMPQTTARNLLSVVSGSAGSLSGRRTLLTLDAGS